MKKGQTLTILFFLVAFALISKAVFGLHKTMRPWPIYGHDASRSGYAPGSAPNTNTTLWTWIGPSSNFRGTPVIAEGIVYTAIYDGVYALDETTGVELWQRQVGTTGDQITGGPTFADGKLYVGTDDGYLYCLNATNGQPIWPVPFEATDTGRIETSPVVGNGKVYFGTADTSETDWFLYAVDAATGEQVWRYTGAGNSIRSSPAIDGTWIFFGCDDGVLYALNDTGNSCQVKWSYETKSQNDFLSTPCVSGDKVFFGTSDEDHSIFALNKTTGAMIWKYTLSVWLRTVNSVAVANDVVYFAPYYPSGCSRAYALKACAPPGIYNEDANDSDIRLWRTTPFTTEPLQSPAATDDKVFFSTWDELHALNASSGASIWGYRFSEPGTVGEPVIADGRIFVACYTTLYCFGDFYPLNTYCYPVNVAGHDYIVKIGANATSKDFDYSNLLSEKRFNYILEANWMQNLTAISKVTIQNEMLRGPYTVRVDGGDPSDKVEIPLNDTHTVICFTYPHLAHEHHVIEITGTFVIPELPSTTILSLLITISLIAVALAKKQLRKN